MIKKLFFTGLMLLSVLWLAAQNVGIGTSTPAAKLDVQGNGISYDVLNVSNNSGTITDRVMVFSNQGNLGIGVTSPGIYKILAHGSPSVFSPQVEVWQGDPYAPGSLMLADINDVGAPSFNGALNLYLSGNKNVAIQALGNSYLLGGNLGIGTTTPRESLELTGAAIVGPVSPPNVGAEVAGTIEWDGFNFVGWTGPGASVFLDAQAPPPTWGVQGMPYGFIELYPISPPASISMGFPGAPNQGGIIWVPDLTWPGQIPHQLMLESTTNATTDASMLFRMSDWAVTPPTLVDEYSQGIFAGDLSFKIYKGPVLGATFQSDFFTMFRANPSGIIDLPNQSRVRAYQEDPTGLYQLIPPLQWTPVNFTIDLQPPYGYDEHGEFTVAAINAVVPAEQAYFTAAEAGYYQVNARCEFNVDEYFEDDQGGWNPVWVNPDSYVSIAIYAGLAPGQTSIYAQGNNLQIGYMYMYEHAMLVQVSFPPDPVEYILEYMMYEEIEKLKNNNAPNVSDVVYLQAGEVISIWVYHTAATPMNLNYLDQASGTVTGKSKVYVSIHKVS